MEPDDKVCYCYGVSLRKLVHFARRRRPARASQMSECLGAGTGCGWCIPVLIKIAEDPEAMSGSEMAAEEYASQRKSYISTKKPRHEF